MLQYIFEVEGHRIRKKFCFLDILCEVLRFVLKSGNFCIQYPCGILFFLTCFIHFLEKMMDLPLLHSLFPITQFIIKRSLIPSACTCIK